MQKMQHVIQLHDTMAFYKLLPKILVLNSTRKQNALNKVRNTQPDSADFISNLLLHPYCNQRERENGEENSECTPKKKHLIETLRAHSVRERGRIKLHNCIIIPVDT